MTQKPGRGGIKVKDITAALMQNPRAGWNFNTLSANLVKLIKLTQTIRRQFAEELFECV